VYLQVVLDQVPHRGGGRCSQPQALGGPGQGVRGTEGGPIQAEQPAHTSNDAHVQQRLKSSACVVGSECYLLIDTNTIDEVLLNWGVCKHG
jgi:hypothetical protein